MEINALNGMKRIIDQSPNLVMMVEWQYGRTLKHNTQKTIEILNFFRDKKYKFYRYVGGNSMKTCNLGKFVD